ncbi:MAG: cytochrome c family protein [Paracoccaceae bacterium]|nr:cytochrome c family protein [Paracoccaceae bacterium]MDG2260366.1 cytochrome c family protein [Paracoccaceae bacterium]
MFDTMTMTKVVGGLCGAFLIFLLGKWVAEEIYHVGPSGHGDHAVQGYMIDTGDDHAAVVVEEGPSFEERFAEANADKGAKVFNKCKACHKVDGANGTGPYLNGVVGRAVGAADGFGYSGALNAVVETWTPEMLDGFLKNPKAFAPGTSMGFNGLGKDADRVNVIAYLQGLGS